MTEAQHDAHVRTRQVWRAITMEPGFIDEVFRLIGHRDALLLQIARDVAREVLGPDHQLMFDCRRCFAVTGVFCDNCPATVGPKLQQ